MTTDTALRLLDNHLTRCKELPSRITPSFSLSATGCSPELIRGAVAMASSGGAVIQFHANQHTREIEDVVDRYGCRPIEYLGEVGALSSGTIVAHAVLTTQREIRLLAESGAGVSYNPHASLWKGNGVCRAAAMLDAGVAVGLGTDATMYDGFRTLQMAEALQRVVSEMPYDDFRGLGAGDWLRVGSSGGAGVAGLASTTGRIAPNFAADFLILNFERPDLSPSWDPESEIVRLADQSAIEEVVVDGESVTIEGQPAHFEGPALLAEIERAAPACIERAQPLKFSSVAHLHR